MLTDGFEYGVGDDSEGFAAANQLAIAQLSALEADAFDMARARDGFRHRPQFHDHPTAACQILFPRGRNHLRAAASIRQRDPARAEPACLHRGIDEIGRASGRERVCKVVKISVVAGTITKKMKKSLHLCTIYH